MVQNPSRQHVLANMNAAAMNMGVQNIFSKFYFIFWSIYSEVDSLDYMVMLLLIFEELPMAPEPLYRISFPATVHKGHIFPHPQRHLLFPIFMTEAIVWVWGCASL